MKLETGRCVPTNLCKARNRFSHDPINSKTANALITWRGSDELTDMGTGLLVVALRWPSWPKALSPHTYIYNKRHIFTHTDRQHRYTEPRPCKVDSIFHTKYDELKTSQELMAVTQKPRLLKLTKPNDFFPSLYAIYTNLTWWLLKCHNHNTQQSLIWPNLEINFSTTVQSWIGLLPKPGSLGRIFYEYLDARMKSGSWDWIFKEYFRTMLRMPGGLDQIFWE